MKNPRPSQAYLQSIMDYNPITGALTWRKRSDVPKGWNTRRAGRAVGWLHKAGNNCYIMTTLNGRHYYAHVLIWVWMTSSWPKNMIDHKEAGDGTNNRWINLREATTSQNSHNGRPRPNPSGYRGVYQVNKRWKARISRNKEYAYLGTFDTPEEAYAAYCKAKKEFAGEFARLD